MKTFRLFSKLAFILTILFGIISCSESTAPSPPSLDAVLLGTYQSFRGEWSENYPSTGPLYECTPTDSARLILNSDRTFYMCLQAYVPKTDSTYTLIQKGSYTIPKSHYHEAESWLFDSDHWEGALVFHPDDARSWKADFSIGYQNNLNFTGSAIFNLPDSQGWLKVSAWRRSKPVL